MAKLVIVFKEKAGLKDILGLATVDEKVLYFSSENPYFWGLTMLPIHFPLPETLDMNLLKVIRHISIVTYYLHLKIE